MREMRWRVPVIKQRKEEIIVIACFDSTLSALSLATVDSTIVNSLLGRSGVWRRSYDCQSFSDGRSLKSSHDSVDVIDGVVHDDYRLVDDGYLGWRCLMFCL